MRMSYRPGTRVRVGAGGGIDGGKTGTIIRPREVKTRGDGVPLLPGYYKPVDWAREVAIRLDDGQIITAFKSGVFREVE